MPSSNSSKLWTTRQLSAVGQLTTVASSPAARLHASYDVTAMPTPSSVMPANRVSRDSTAGDDVDLPVVTRRPTRDASGRPRVRNSARSAATAADVLRPASILYNRRTKVQCQLGLFHRISRGRDIKQRSAAVGALHTQIT
jgi:hypothetical protein